MPPMVMAGVMVASMAMAAASAAQQARAASMAGKAASANAKYNARMAAQELQQKAMLVEVEAEAADEQARQEREATAFDVAQAAEQGERYQATQRVAVGASGVESTGSPLLVMVETARNLALDRLVMTHAGEQKAQEYERQARLQRYQAQTLRAGVPLQLDIGRVQGQTARSVGRAQSTASLLQGAGQVAGMAAQTYSMYRSAYPPPPKTPAAPAKGG